MALDPQISMMHIPQVLDAIGEFTKENMDDTEEYLFALIHYWCQVKELTLAHEGGRKAKSDFADNTKRAIELLEKFKTQYEKSTSVPTCTGILDPRAKETWSRQDG